MLASHFESLKFLCIKQIEKHLTKLKINVTFCHDAGKKTKLTHSTSESILNSAAELDGNQFRIDA